MSRIQKAKLEDAQPIHRLLMDFARQGTVLPRSLSDICGNLRDFYVCLENNKIIGCGALHITWTDLGEIRSLAVMAKYQRRGIGARIVNRCLKEAEEMRIPRVFTLTFAPEFFSRLGFHEVSRDSLPHKIWTGCVNCPHFPDCGEVPLALDLPRKR